MNVIKLAIGSGMLLLSYGVHSQPISEKTDSDKKRAAEFNPLSVSVGKTTSEQEALEKTGATSSWTTDKNLQSPDVTVRSMPGTYTQIDPGQGAINVNIRGMSGFDRVNIMVDGITQSFYGTSASGTTTHGSANNMAGVLIDPNLLAAADATRDDSSDSEGTNVFTDNTNTRITDADDVISNGSTYGLRSRFSVDSNGPGRSGMIALSGESDASTDTRSIGVMAAVNGSSVYSDFSNDSGIDSKEFDYDKYIKQNSKSQLYKMDVRPGEFNSFELSARTYENKFIRRDITSDDYYIKYHYTPSSELIDFNVTANTSRGNQKYRDGSLYIFYKTSAQNRSDALDTDNTSRFIVANNDLEFILGSRLMHARCDRTIHSAVGGPRANRESIENNPFVPFGQQGISALYTGLKVTHGIWEAGLNLNYTRNRITGYKPTYDSRVTCMPQSSYDIDGKKGGFNPSIQPSAQVTPRLQPFIGYSKSMRAPNIQEMFFFNSGGTSMNLFLKPERVET